VMLGIIVHFSYENKVPGFQLELECTPGLLISVRSAPKRV
jgi:hypothetical protein